MSMMQKRGNSGAATEGLGIAGLLQLVTRWSNLTNMFQAGWNHQLVFFVVWRRQIHVMKRYIIFILISLTHRIHETGMYGINAGKYTSPMDPNGQ